VPLPANLNAEQTLYLSLTRHDLATNKDALLATLVLPIFIDAVGPQLSWQQFPTFAAPTSGGAMGINLRRIVDGAPLSAPLSVEYSIDNKTWTSLKVAETPAANDPSLVSLSFVYPLANEAPFHLRARAIDAAGNTVQTGVSPGLVGRAGMQLAVADAERTACLSSGAPAARLQPWLASSVSCKKADNTGQLAGSSYATLVWQNRGQVAPTFFATTQISEGMAYRVLADGVMVASGRFTPPDLFRLAPTTMRLNHFVINDAWLSAKRVEVVFDIEASDAYSTTNGCYPDNARNPSVVIQDQNQGFTLGQSPFGCDSDALLNP
jgi:hypothetical protein